jgi:hypothetical protein
MPTFEKYMNEETKRHERLCHHKYDAINRCQNEAKNGNVYCTEHKHLYHHDDARGQ